MATRVTAVDVETGELHIARRLALEVVRNGLSAHDILQKDAARAGAEER